MKKFALTVDSFENGNVHREIEPVDVTESELIEHIKFHLQKGVPLQINIDGQKVVFLEESKLKSPMIQNQRNKILN